MENGRRREGEEGGEGGWRRGRREGGGGRERGDTLVVELLGGGHVGQLSLHIAQVETRLRIRRIIRSLRERGEGGRRRKEEGEKEGSVRRRVSPWQ